MKKKMRFWKILLLILTVFSQVASPIAVLADEIINKPLNVSLSEVDEDNDGYIDYLRVRYISVNENDYDYEKNYTIKLETTFTYLDETKSLTKEDSILVDGTTLNDVKSSYLIDVDDEEVPLSKYYDGTYSVVLSVFDSESEDKLYSETYQYDYETLKGISGKLAYGEGSYLNADENNNYNVTFEQGREYTQWLYVLTGNLSPNGLYRVSVNGKEFSEPMSADTLRETPFSGTVTDLSGRLAGTYSYTDGLTVESVQCEDGSECTVLESYDYQYEAVINYGNASDNDALLSEMLGYTFENGYLVLDAIGYNGAEAVSTLGEFVSKYEMMEQGVELSIYDDQDNLLYSSSLGCIDESVLSSMVKNNFVFEFTNTDNEGNVTSVYKVLVKGNLTDDEEDTNEFNKKDLEALLEGYLNEENIPSMDLYPDEEKEEENGTITFEDVVVTNELLKKVSNTEEREDNSENFAVLLGNDAASEIFVGDEFNVTLRVKGDVLDYIDGIDGEVVLSDNLKLIGVTYNEKLTGFNKEERFTAVGNELTSDDVLVTLTFMATSEGEGNVSVKGQVSKYLNIKDISELTTSVTIVRNISTNNYLASLKASVGTFDAEFDKAVTVYTLTVPYDTEKVILSGALEDVYASATGLIEYELTEDKTTAIITVVAEDGSKRVYTVYIIKDNPPVVSTPVVYYYSSNSHLETLTVTSYDLEFNRDVYEYRIKVGNDVSSLDIRALAEDSRSRVEITGNSDFKVGENVVIVKVTAEDGSTSEYKLIVEKEAAEVTPNKGNDKESSNMVEKVIIIILIILVVLGLLYLIFKKDDDNSNKLEDKSFLDKRQKRENKKK